MRTTLSAIALLALFTASAAAQATPSPAPAPASPALSQRPAAQPAPAAKPAPGVPAVHAQTYTFTANSRLVVEAVTVTDKNGKAIEGLTAKDFTITEDNVPQTITNCDYQRLEDVPALPATPALTTRAAAAAAKPSAPPVTTFDIAPEAPGDTRFTNKRLLVLYFDMTAMPQEDQLRAFDYATKFVKTQMIPSDLVAVVEYDGNGVKVPLDFTGDRDTILAAIEKLLEQSAGFGFDSANSDADASDTGSAFGQDDSEFNVFNTNRQLAALQTTVGMLAPINEKKALIYFASGLSLNGLDNQAQLTATVNNAIRANVSFFPVDARGLVALPPMGDASHGSAGGLSMYNGSAMSAGVNRLQMSQSTLYELGADTGGKALLDNNDLSVGIVNAEKAISSYYLLAYYTSNGKLDGRLRKIKVTYNADPTAKLSYRVGYYAGKEYGKFTEADKERQLEDALMTGEPLTDLTIALEVNYFELNGSEYFVPIAAKIPGSELALAKAGGAEKSVVDLVGEIKDDYGTTITNLRDIAEIKLTGESAQELSRKPVEFTSGYTLLPGNYVLKVLIRDNETGRIGTYIKKFNVPNLAKLASDPARAGILPLSSVVLSSQWVALTDALFNAKKDTAKDEQQKANPLVQNGNELMPSVTHVFSQHQQLYVYLQAYERCPTPPDAACPYTAAMKPLVAFVTFYNGDGTRAWQAPPEQITQGLDAHSRAIPINFTLPLTSLAPGHYLCQVTVIDPASQKAGFSLDDVTIVP